MRARHAVAAALLLPACARPPQRPIATAWLVERLPPGARVLIEGPEAAALPDDREVEAVASLAALDRGRRLAAEWLVFDSRVHGPAVARGGGAAAAARAAARDPAFEILDLFESGSGRGAVRLLLLRRRGEPWIAVGQTTLEPACDGARWVALHEEARPFGLARLEVEGTGIGGLHVDDRPVEWEPGSVRSRPFSVDGGTRRIEIDAESVTSLRLVRLLSVEALPRATWSEGTPSAGTAR